MKAVRGDCILLVIDVQDKLVGSVAEHIKVAENIKALVKVSSLLGIPIVATEQEKLGGTITGIMALLKDAKPFLKLSFSCCDAGGFIERLRGLNRKTIIICGIEAHICVLQTSLDLMELGFKTFVVNDAVSSHASGDCDSAVERMRGEGAVITTTESLIFELMGKAGTPEFKSILDIVKERRRTLS